MQIIVVHLKVQLQYLYYPDDCEALSFALAIISLSGCDRSVTKYDVTTRYVMLRLHQGASRLILASVCIKLVWTFRIM